MTKTTPEQIAREALDRHAAIDAQHLTGVNALTIAIAAINLDRAQQSRGEEVATDPIGTVWHEKARPGHSVEIVGTALFRGKAYGVDTYIIEHLTAHNIRKQTSLTRISVKNFTARYTQKEETND